MTWPRRSCTSTWKELWIADQLSGVPAGDPALVARLRDEGVPLTMCPLSNLSLRVVDRLEDHPLRLIHRLRLSGHSGRGRASRLGA